MRGKDVIAAIFFIIGMSIAGAEAETIINQLVVSGIGVCFMIFAITLVKGIKIR